MTISLDTEGCVYYLLSMSKGVDDEGNIKGVEDTKKAEEMIRNIAQENYNPPIQLETTVHDINKKLWQYTTRNAQNLTSVAMM